jgi:hypothetical protein
MSVSKCGRRMWRCEFGQGSLSERAARRGAETAPYLCQDRDMDTFHKLYIVNRK